MYVLITVYDTCGDQDVLTDRKVKKRHSGDPRLFSGNRIDCHNSNSVCLFLHFVPRSCLRLHTLVHWLLRQV